MTAWQRFKERWAIRWVGWHEIQVDPIPPPPKLREGCIRKAERSWTPAFCIDFSCGNCGIWWSELFAKGVNVDPTLNIYGRKTGRVEVDDPANHHRERRRGFDAKYWSRFYRVTCPNCAADGRVRIMMRKPAYGGGMR